MPQESATIAGLKRSGPLTFVAPAARKFLLRKASANVADREQRRLTPKSSILAAVILELLAQKLPKLRRLPWT
jgi:hypothetical protein